MSVWLWVRGQPGQANGLWLVMRTRLIFFFWQMLVHCWVSGASCPFLRAHSGGAATLFVCGGCFWGGVVCENCIVDASI